MKKILKIALILICIALLFIVGAMGYVYIALPNVGPPPDIKVELTPDRIERGKYLVDNIAMCLDCHSERDWSLFAGPIIPGTEGKGGDLRDESTGYPYKLYLSNLTPYALGSWTDGEIYRAITTGVNKDGEAIFPEMPYAMYNTMDPEDVKDMIAYLRTLKPIKNDVPKLKATFPFNILNKLSPLPAQPTKRPPKSDKINYGKYIGGGCIVCHTPQDKGKPINEMYLAGGFEFIMPNGDTVISSNITPDKETGIGGWSKEAFVQRFQLYIDSTYEIPKIPEGKMNTPMPWRLIARMEKEDLEAIYEFLASVEPVKNKVTNPTLYGK